MTEESTVETSWKEKGCYGMDSMGDGTWKVIADNLSGTSKYGESWGLRFLNGSRSSYVTCTLQLKLKFVYV